MNKMIFVGCLYLFSLPAFAADSCAVAHQPPLPLQGSAQVTHSNWLLPENLRFGLQSAARFLPQVRIDPPGRTTRLRTLARPLELKKIIATDPADNQPRDLDFLLQTRLYADSVLVLQNGNILAEGTWHGFSAQQPRLLLEGTRPVLSLLGAMAARQGKLIPDRSLIRHVAPLSGQTGLRKLSLQRLLENNSRFDWTPQELAAWRSASGWLPGKGIDEGVRAWLNAPARWDRDFSESPPVLADNGPDGDLLVWALTESYRQPLAQIFCQQVLTRIRPENPVFWATDARGAELSAGLSMSLRDFARLGQALLEAHHSGARSRIPNWFIETLIAPGHLRKAANENLNGLPRGSDLRYGFVHLGDNRVALLAPHGTSLYVDFDRRLVVALYASYPVRQSVAMLATLNALWDTLGRVSDRR